MTIRSPFILRRIITISLLLLFVLLIVMIAGVSMGSTKIGLKMLLQSLIGGKMADTMLDTIVWQIRFPRVLLAGLVGATLSLGGLVFQAILRNPLAEPYILGISGGSAIGAIIGILLGLSRFPGVSFTAFLGSLATLILLLIMSLGKSLLKKNTLLLSGVMVNAFCSAIIMFLVSMTYDARLHNIIFWLMGDLSMCDIKQVGILSLMLLPCFIILFCYSHSMNIILMGNEMAQTMGINIKKVTALLLIVTSFMVSSTVCYCGLLGFVGLVIPHLLRLIFGPDHRILVPASILGGASYMIICDLLARSLPQQGEIPVGVVTAMIGAPLFIYLLKRSKQ